MSDSTYDGIRTKPAKPLVWLHGEVRTRPFSSRARVEAGVLLRQLQEHGKPSLPHSRPMPGIGRACHELRIQDQDRTWRIMYCIDTAAIVVLEVFAKATARTPLAIFDVCKARLGRYRVVAKEDRV